MLKKTIALGISHSLHRSSFQNRARCAGLRFRFFRYHHSHQKGENPNWILSFLATRRRRAMIRFAQIGRREYPIPLRHRPMRDKTASDLNCPGVPCRKNSASFRFRGFRKSRENCISAESFFLSPMLPMLRQSVDSLRKEATLRSHIAVGGSGLVKPRITAPPPRSPACGSGEREAGSVLFFSPTWDTL